MKEITLKDYQVKALTNIQSNYDSKVKSQILIMATGTGKTVVFTRFIKDNPDKRFLILVHRDHLVSQSLEKISHQMNESVGIEKAESRAGQERIVIASVQTLKGKRLKAFDRNRFDVIIIDECHRSTADSYLEVRKHFSKAHVLGVTATPERNDERKLSKKHYKKIAFEYDLETAINEGNLCRIRAWAIESKINIDSARKAGDDLNQEDLANILENDEYIKLVSDTIQKHCIKNKTIVFMPRVSMCYSLKESLSRMNINSEVVNADISGEERKDILARYKAGKVKVLINYNIFTEGFDEPSIDCVVMARPTMSKIFYSQAVGRITRLMKGKEYAKLIDITVNSRKHSLINPFSLVIQNEEISKEYNEQEINGKDFCEMLNYSRKKLEEIQYRYKQIDILSKQSIMKKRSITKEEIHLFLKSFRMDG